MWFYLMLPISGRMAYTYFSSARSGRETRCSLLILRSVFFNFFQHGLIAGLHAGTATGLVAIVADGFVSVGVEIPESGGSLTGSMLGFNLRAEHAGCFHIALLEVGFGPLGGIGSVAVLIAGDDNLDTFFAQLCLAFKELHPFGVVIADDEGADEVIICCGVNLSTHPATLFENLGGHPALPRILLQKDLIGFFQHLHLGRAFGREDGRCQHERRKEGKQGRFVHSGEILSG